MDYNLFENSKCISAVYKDKMPNLKNIEITKMVFMPGEDAELTVTIDTIELPQEMPSKWLMQKANTIQIEIVFIGIENIIFDFTNGSRCDFNLINNNGLKYVCFKSNVDEKEISFNAKWIYVKQISAYTNQTTNEEQWI